MTDIGYKFDSDEGDESHEMKKLYGRHAGA
jgi:hypothetical protein